MPKVCLNMIVRNEADRIIRCLESVLPVIDCWSITDTGSTDDTKSLIVNFFKKHKVHGKLHDAPFENFEQARNVALNHARYDNSLTFDYLLFTDADMQLVVKDKDWHKELKGGMAYDVEQVGNQLRYHNKRFMHRFAKGEYKGVTHEYLNVPSAGWVTGLEFKDYGDGSNRKDKFVRDIALLIDGLEKEPGNERYWFYLAQSYKDAGQWEKASEAYRQRALMGGWEEEVWYSWYTHAICQKELGNEAEFVKAMIYAYNLRPTRAEPCYQLAAHYRHVGMNRASLVWSELGLTIPYPAQDRLFISDYVYKVGLLEEFAICGFYGDEQRRKMAFHATNKIALAKEATEFSRWQARNNLYHFLKPLSERCPSFMAENISYNPEKDWVPLNPSVCVVNDKIYTTIRTVNYTIDNAGRYLIRGTDGECNGTNPINTRNFLLRLDGNLRVEESQEILPPDMRAPEFPLVRGFEDMRLFHWQGSLWTSSCVREMTKEGWCEQVIARIGNDGKLADWHRMLPADRVHEKNWMPSVKDGELRFFYRPGQVVDENAKVILERAVPLAVDRICGGSQAIQYNGGWLALVHESNHIPGTSRRYYAHRFVWWDQHYNMRRLTNPFVFHDRVIEFAAGLAWHPDGDRLLISYGREDSQACIATVLKDEVHSMVFND